MALYFTVDIHGVFTLASSPKAIWGDAELENFSFQKITAPLQIDRNGKSFTCSTRGLLLHPLLRVAGSDQGIPNNMHYVVIQLLSGFVSSMLPLSLRCVYNVHVLRIIGRVWGCAVP